MNDYSTCTIGIDLGDRTSVACNLSCDVHGHPCHLGNLRLRRFGPQHAPNPERFIQECG